MLHEMQTRMATALLGGDPAPPSDLAPPGGGVGLDRRFGVHRATVAQSLTAVLAAAFPLVETILGPSRFVPLADAFARQHPPTRAALYAYGAEFPAWLARRPEASRIAYLADMARVDWARHAAYFAAEAPRLDPAALGAPLAEGDPTALAFTPHPAASTIVSRAPVARLAAALTGREAGDDTPIRVPDHGEALLVHRLADGTVVDVPLTLIEGIATAALLDGATLGQAVAAVGKAGSAGDGSAEAAADTLDLQNLLARLFHLRVFSDASPSRRQEG